MNAAQIIQRIQQRAVAPVFSMSTTVAHNQLFNSMSEEAIPSGGKPAPYETVGMPEGPGVDQLNDLLGILPPLSLKWGPWVAGGAVRRIIRGEKLDDGDIDFFFSDPSEFIKFDRALSDYEEVHSSGKAKTYIVNGLKVQIIKRTFYKDAGMMFGDFDFSACQLATDGHKIAYAEHSIEDVQNDRLRIAKVGRVTKLTIVGRMIKYINHGLVPEPGLFRMIVEAGLDVTGAHKIFDHERPAANYDHEEKVEEILDAKVFDSNALREAAERLGVELPE